MKRTGIIGFGNMGEAIVKGLRKKHPAAEIAVYDKSDEKKENGADRYSALACASVNELIDYSDTVIIAVKPQDAPSLLKQIAPLSRSKNIISIMAGRSVSYIADSLKTENICRFMPNIAAQCGYSMTALSFHEKAEESFIPEAVEIAESFGTAFILPEKLMSAFTGLSGSGIAFVFQFIHAVSMGGVRSGISYPDSLKIVLATARGALETVKSTGRGPLELITSVASPAGTTIEGLRVLEEKGFNAAAMDAVFAACIRAMEMEET